MSLEFIDNEQIKLEALWSLGDYSGQECPSCGRERLCFCNNGKQRCEKCNWVPEDDDYCPVSL